MGKGQRAVEPSPPSPPARQVDARSLRGLAHPLRVRILDALVTFGPATATMLAERFGENSASTSYHLRQLAKHGFVVDDRTLGAGRERYWRAEPSGTSINSYDLMASPATSEATRLVIDEFHRAQNARYEHWLAVGHHAGTREWAMASASVTNHLRLTAEELAELSAALVAVLDTWRARVRGRGAQAEPDTVGTQTVEVQLRTFPVTTTAAE